MEEMVRAASEASLACRLPVRFKAGIYVRKPFGRFHKAERNSGGRYRGPIDGLLKMGNIDSA